MSRAMVQLSIDTKAELDALKKKLRLKTLSDVVAKLIQGYFDFEKFKGQKVKEQEKEQERREKEDIHLGVDLKSRINDLSNDLECSHQATIELLLAHFAASEKLDMSTFRLYKSLRKND